MTLTTTTLVTEYLSIRAFSCICVIYSSYRHFHFFVAVFVVFFLDGPMLWPKLRVLLPVPLSAKIAGMICRALYFHLYFIDHKAVVERSNQKRINTVSLPSPLSKTGSHYTALAALGLTL